MITDRLGGACYRFEMLRQRNETRLGGSVWLQPKDTLTFNINLHLDQATGIW